jgi:hypothetical protein
MLISRKYAGVEILHPVDTSDRILNKHTYSKQEMDSLSAGITEEFRRIRERTPITSLPEARVYTTEH